MTPLCPGNAQDMGIAFRSVAANLGCAVCPDAQGPVRDQPQHHFLRSTCFSQYQYGAAAELLAHTWANAEHRTEPRRHLRVSCITHNTHKQAGILSSLLQQSYVSKAQSSWWPFLWLKPGRPSRTVISSRLAAFAYAIHLCTKGGFGSMADAYVLTAA